MGIAARTAKKSRKDGTDARYSMSARKDSARRAKGMRCFRSLNLPVIIFHGDLFSAGIQVELRGGCVERSRARGYWKR